MSVCKIESTDEIIQQWSAKGKRNQNLITIQDLLEALKKMERVDVIETVKSKILEDCKKASGLIKWKGHQSLSSLDTTHSLTVAVSLLHNTLLYSVVIIATLDTCRKPTQ